ncbi:hypothetical protein ACFXK0_13365 [Nocardia sp. NPDC059177]|uniref:hypothetical protein n=1 Tax=Nocardia sp. NPDC059177 TaxID=3346759 RepID=UPI0036B9A06E
MTKHAGLGCRAQAAVRPLPSGPPGARIPGELVRSARYDLLDYFAKCPRCGYAAQASETILAYSSGLVERRQYRTCGQPCGWHDSSVEVADTVVAGSARAG